MRGHFRYTFSFQALSPLHLRAISPLHLAPLQQWLPLAVLVALRPRGKWEQEFWHYEWVIARIDVSERLVLPTAEPPSVHKNWRTMPSLPSEFDPVLGKIRELATLTHMLRDFLECQIALL